MTQGVRSLQIRFRVSARSIVGFVLIIQGALRAQQMVPGASRPAATQPAAYPAFAKYLPVWAAAYLEVTDLKDSIDAASSRTSTQGAGKLASKLPSALGEFNTLMKRTLGLSGRKFFADLLGKRFALAWGGPDSQDQFGLICQPAGTASIAKLLGASKAEKIDSKDAGKKVSLYKLPSSDLRIATFEDKFILATVGRTGNTGMFYAMVDLAEGSSVNNLTANPKFTRICRELPKGYKGFFAVFANEQVPGRVLTRTDPLVQHIVQQVSYFAAAGYSRDNAFNLRFTVEPREVDPSFWPQQPLRLDPAFWKLVQADSLVLAYAQTIEPARWYEQVARVADEGRFPATNYRAILEALLPEPEVRRQCLEAIGPEMLVLITVSPRRPTSTASVKSPSFQADFALIVALKNPQVVQRTMDQISSFLTGLATLQVLRPSPQAILPPKETAYRGSTIHRVPVRLVPGRGVSWPEIIPIRPYNEIAYVFMDDYLIFATDHNWLKRIIDRRSATGTTSQPRNPSDRESKLMHWLLMIDLANLAKCVEQVAGERDKKVPTTNPTTRPTEEQSRVVLGVWLKTISHEETAKPNVQVIAVQQGYPAWGNLYPGDIILGIDDVTLTADDPQKQLRELLAARADQPVLELTVKRKDDIRRIKIALKPYTLLTKKTLGILRQAVSLISRKFKKLTMTAVYEPTGQVRVETTLK